MTIPRATSTKASSGATQSGRLFLLELSGDRIHSMNPDGSDRKTIVTNCHLPDGIVVDAEAGHIYWTNMGIPNLDDGSIERADPDGKNRKVIVPQGITHTPQLHSAIGLFVLSYIGIAISLPMIVPHHFTLWQTAASERTQAFLLVGTFVLLPVILMYIGSRQGAQRRGLPRD